MAEFDVALRLRIAREQSGFSLASIEAHTLCWAALISNSTNIQPRIFPDDR
jgi:hypothetical protein